MLLGRKHIIVATSALAMGVSIKHVDLVIHYNCQRRCDFVIFR